jgi:hypothetical protein
LEAKARYRSEVEELTRFKDAHIVYLSFLESIINTEPNLQKACPTDLELIPFLNGAL